MNIDKLKCFQTIHIQHGDQSVNAVSLNNPPPSLSLRLPLFLNICYTHFHNILTYLELESSNLQSMCMYQILGDVFKSN